MKSELRLLSLSAGLAVVLLGCGGNPNVTVKPAGTALANIDGDPIYGNSGSSGDSGSSGSTGSSGSSGATGSSGSNGGGGGGSSGSTGGNMSGGCDNSCVPKTYSFTFNARKLTCDEKAKYTLPFSLPVEDINSGNKTQNGTAYVQDGQTVFAFDVTGLPARNTILKATKARINLSIIRHGDAHNLNDQLLCFLDPKVCSGDVEGEGCNKYNNPELNSCFFKNFNISNDYFEDVTIEKGYCASGCSQKDGISALLALFKTPAVDTSDDDAETILSSSAAHAACSTPPKNSCDYHNGNGNQCDGDLHKGKVELKVKQLLGHSSYSVLDLLYGTTMCDGAMAPTGTRTIPIAVGDDLFVSDCDAQLVITLEGNNCSAPTGSSGVTGASGTSGSSGSTGSTGSSGITGSTGSSGSSGSSGSTGSTGTSGTSGITGSTGTTAPTNPLGN